MSKFSGTFHKLQQELTNQHLPHVGITPITREKDVMISKLLSTKFFKCKHFQTLFTKSKSLSHFGITRITLEKDGLCGNLCHLAASLPQTYVLFKAFKLSPVKHSSAFSFHDNLPFIHQPASNNFLLSPKKRLKSNFVRIPWLMCCFSAVSKNIHYYGDFHLRPATQKRASLRQ